MDEYWIGYDLGYDEGYVEKPSISAIMKGAATQGEEYSKVGWKSREKSTD